LLAANQIRHRKSSSGGLNPASTAQKSSDSFFRQAARPYGQLFATTSVKQRVRPFPEGLLALTVILGLNAFRPFLRPHPRQLQPALHLTLMAQIVGFTRELTMPLSDCRIASGAQWFAFPQAP
jgi:hypothetical protein